MTYDSPTVANNILQRCFEEHVHINYQQLQKILFLSACEYAKLTSKPMLVEPFSTWAYGPISYTVHSLFSCYGTGVDNNHDIVAQKITRYARNSKGKANVIDEQLDVELHVALDLVWQKTKNLTSLQLINITRLPDSAWDKSYQQDKPFIDHEDMYTDTTYYEPLGLHLR